MTIYRPLSAKRAAVAIAVVIMAAGLLVARPSGHAAATSALADPGQSKAGSLRLLARQDVFQFVNNPPAGDSAGDLVVASDKVYDRRSRRRLGRNHVTGIETVPGKSIALTATLVLGRGEIALQGVTGEQNDRPFRLAITGGTGAYRDASGVARIVPLSRTVSQMTVSVRRH